MPGRISHSLFFVEARPTSAYRPADGNPLQALAKETIVERPFVLETHITVRTDSIAAAPH